VVTARPVFVMNIDTDLLANSSGHVKLNRPGITHQVGRHVNLDIIDADDAVWREVLPLEVRVDRHVVFGAASTDRRDEVDRCDPTSLLDQFSRILGNKEVHVVVTPLKGKLIPAAYCSLASAGSCCSSVT